MKIYWTGKSKNIIGTKIKQIRTEQGLTQKVLAEKLQLEGFEFSDLTILRIENGTRFVADYEVKALSKILCVSYEFLLG
ncbi:helix-turn-helix domain-containing protein [Sporobacter termitidis]|uniref:helix-turn-helix domain-containing protein n=1 Tax=Sporobacter termitidis TaxID=44749 RepID=UPI00093514D9|nr:helix-turn-helix transcriptional regulator [Sporobacter termitidis]